MATATNPLNALLPGQNPTGNQLTVPYGGTAGGSTSTGANPLMPAVPSGPTTTANPYSQYNFEAYASPYNSPGSSTLNTGVVAPPNNPQSGAVGVTGTAAGLGAPTTVQGQHQLWDQLSKTYGPGMATTLQNFLSGGAGFNQQAINQLLAAMQPGFAQSQQNLLTSFGASGNRFSSGAQIGMADLMGQEQLDVGQIESQMYEKSVTDYLDVLMGTAGADASRIANQSSTWDTISSALGLAGSGAGALSAAGVGGGSGGLSSILSGLAVL